MNGPCAHFFLEKNVSKAVNEVLDQMLSSAVTMLGYEYWGSELLRQGRYSLLRVYIESERGITLDDCERVSRQISALLDVEDPISGSYTLEVSSPGMDRPLFTVAHYQKAIGKKIKVRMRVPQNDRRNFLGELKTVNHEAITVMGDGETWILPLAEIEKANVVPEY